MKRFFMGAIALAVLLWTASVAGAGPMYLTADTGNAPELESADEPSLEQVGGTKSPSVSLHDSATNPVPEPATLLLLGVGLVGVAGLRRLRRSRD